MAVLSIVILIRYIHNLYMKFETILILSLIQFGPVFIRFSSVFQSRLVYFNPVLNVHIMKCGLVSVVLIDRKIYLSVSLFSLLVQSGPDVSVTCLRTALHIAREGKLQSAVGCTKNKAILEKIQFFKQKQRLLNI